MLLFQINHKISWYYIAPDCKGQCEACECYLLILTISIIYTTVFYLHLRVIAKIIYITDCLEVVLKPA